MLAVGLGPDPATRGADGTAGAPDLAEQVRRAAGAAARAFPKSATRIGSTLSELDLAAAVEGTVLGAYTFTDYRTATDDEPLRTVTFLGAPGGSGGAPEREHATLADAAMRARAVCSARDLVNTPPNDLYPAEFAVARSSWPRRPGSRSRCSTSRARARPVTAAILGVGGGSSAPAAAASGSATRPAGAREGRAGRQGHHLRHRRHLDQAGREHGPHELGHGRRRRASSPPSAWPPS